MNGLKIAIIASAEHVLPSCTPPTPRVIIDTIIRQQLLLLLLLLLILLAAIRGRWWGF